MGFTKADVERAEALRETARMLRKEVDRLDGLREELKGAEKGRLTRERNDLRREVDVIKEELKVLPREPIDPAEAFAMLMDRVLEAKRTYDEEKGKFMERAARNPADAVERAYRVVMAQQQWELMVPAERASSYEELVECLQAIDEKNRVYLLEWSGNLYNSTSQFHNVVNMARHNGRVKFHRRGATYILKDIETYYAPGVESWRLLNG